MLSINGRWVDDPQQVSALRHRCRSSSGDHHRRGCCARRKCSRRAQRTSADIPFNKLSFTFGSADDAVGIFKTVGDGMSPTNEAGVKMTRFDNNLDDGPPSATPASWCRTSRPSRSTGTPSSESGRRRRNLHKGAHPLPGGEPADQGLRLVWFVQRSDGPRCRPRHRPGRQSRGWRHNTTIIMVIAAANGREVNNGPRYFYVSTAKVLPYFKQVTPESIGPQTTTIGGKNGIQIDCKSTIDGAYAEQRTSSPRFRRATTSFCTARTMTAVRAHTTRSSRPDSGTGSSPAASAQHPTACKSSEPIRTGSLKARCSSRTGRLHPQRSSRNRRRCKHPPLTAAPQVMLTKSNVNDYYNGNNVKKLPPLQSNNQYLAKYGILQKFGKIKGLNTK